MAITKAAVFKAADEIAAEGGTPTFASVRQRVGGGSYSTIGKLLKEWKNSPGRGYPPLPDVLRAALLRVGTEIWVAALKEAEKHNRQGGFKGTPPADE